MVLEAIIFDLDGTIVNSTEVQWHAFNKYLSQFSVEITWNDWTRVYLGWKSVNIWEMVLEKNNLSISIDHAQKERRKIYNRLVKEGELREITGFSKFFEWLKMNFPLTFPIVIASNGHSSSIETSLNSIGYLRKIKYYSADIDKQRVSKEVLLKTVVQNIDVDPSKCLIFEDSPLGAKAASKNGIKTVIINTSNLPKNYFNVDLIIDDYTSPQLFSFIERVK